MSASKKKFEWPAGQRSVWSHFPVETAEFFAAADAEADYEDGLTSFLPIEVVVRRAQERIAQEGKK